MRIDRTAVPGNGMLHQLESRGGDRFCVLVDELGDRRVFLYDVGRDEPAQSILLGPDEADQLADILHSRPLPDRVLALERRVDELLRQRGGCGEMK